MSIVNQLPTLFSFIAAWYPDADLEGMDDREVVRAYLKTVTTNERAKAISECKQLLEVSPLPLQVIADQAWRLFPSDAECRVWLEMILQELEIQV